MACWLQLTCVLYNWYSEAVNTGCSPSGRFAWLMPFSMHLHFSATQRLLTSWKFRALKETMTCRLNYIKLAFKKKLVRFCSKHYLAFTQESAKYVSRVQRDIGRMASRSHVCLGFHGSDNKLNWTGLHRAIMAKFHTNVRDASLHVLETHSLSRFEKRWTQMCT